MKISKTYTYKLRTNKEENRNLHQILTATTFCHNLYLHYNKKFFKSSKKKIDLAKMFSQLPTFKKQYDELRHVDDIYFNSCIVDLFYSLKPIQDENSFPDFKKENRRIVLLRDYSINEEASSITLPKLGSISYVKSRKLKGTVKAVHLVNKFDEWFLDVILQHDAPPPSRQKNLRFVGIDVGLNDFAILSNGMKVQNPRFYRNLEDKLKKEQQCLSRKQKGSSNWGKQLLKVRKVHRKIHNSRMNFLHELTSYLISEFDVIGIEKLAISEMKRDRRFAKSIQDASWGIFIKLLKYKAVEKGKIIVEVDRYYPSTKTCSKCGHTEIVPLHLRRFKCSRCFFEIHRDYNAAINIEHKAVHYAFSKNLMGNGG